MGFGFLFDIVQAKNQSPFFVPVNLVKTDNRLNDSNNIKYPPKVQLTESSSIFQPETTSDSQNLSVVYKKFENDVADFQSAKNIYGKNGPADKSAQNDYLRESQKILSDIINVLILRNQDLDAEIKENSDYYGNAGKNISDMIGKDNKTLNELFLKTNFVSDAKSLGTVANDIKNIRFNQQSYLKKLILSAHLGHYQEVVIKTAQRREEIIKREIDRVKKRGKDVLSLENMLNQADNFVNLAASSTDLANGLVGSQNIDVETLSQIQDLLSSAIQSVQSAYKIFKQIVIDGNVLYSRKNATSTLSNSSLNLINNNSTGTTSNSSSSGQF